MHNIRGGNITLRSNQLNVLQILGFMLMDIIISTRGSHRQQIQSNQNQQLVPFY